MMPVTTMVSKAMKNYWSWLIELYRASARPTAIGVEHSSNETTPSRVNGTSLLELVSTIES